MVTASRSSTFLAMTLAAIVFGNQPLLAQNLRISGIIKQASGEPVAGALVKFQSVPPGRGFMVVSQPQGLYQSPGLPPGKYVVQAFGGVNRSSPSSPIEAGNENQGKLDLVLSVPQQIPPHEKRLTDLEYEKMLPEAEGKLLVTSRCTTCHGLLPIVSQRKTKEGWQQTLDEMRDNVQDSRMPLTISRADGLTQELGDAIVDYLAKNLGSDRPLDPQAKERWLARPANASQEGNNLPPALLEGGAAKYLAMEFTLPAGANPSDVATDSHGVVWVAEKNSGMLGRLDPGTLAYTRTPVPHGTSSESRLGPIMVDPKDQVWLADNGNNVRIVRFVQQSGEFQSYPVPDYPYPKPNIGAARIGTLSHFDGEIWATGTLSNKILKLDPSSGKILQYPISKGSFPVGIGVGGDKKIWYTGQVANSVAKLDSTTGLITGRFKLSTAMSGLRGLVADSDGNLWAAATESGKLVRVDYKNGKITEFAPPSEDSGPYWIDFDRSRGSLWFSELFADRLARFDRDTQKVTEFPLPSASSDARRIKVDVSRPNRIWWAGTRSNKVGYVEVID